MQEIRPLQANAAAQHSPSNRHAARIERALIASLPPDEARAPPQLAAAVRHALFPGGARLRPKLCLAVAAACDDPEPALADAAAAAVEMMHCASLVHDDLPCFDDAETRRGQSSVHRAFSEGIAVLTGDQLIVRAFEHLARVGASSPRKLAELIGVLARGVSAPYGIVAGQAWESEPMVDSSAYRRAKTGALFEAAATLGAIAAGVPPRPWMAAFARIGDAYQVADDILDVIGDPEQLGKPVGQDRARGRPNAANELGLSGARRLFDRMMQEAAAALPECPDPEPVRQWLNDLRWRGCGL